MKLDRMSAQPAKRYGGRGALFAIVLSLPLAALCALVYRFPVPFSAYESGVAAMPRAFGAAIFYGLLGGFVVLAIAGYLSGRLAMRLGAGDAQKAARLTLLFSGMVAFAGVFTLAILDKLIGPW